MPPPDSFLCPITSCLMADPVSTSDGFSYEREAICQWFDEGHHTSPLTGAELSRGTLVPNHALRTAIQCYVDEHPEVAGDLYRPRGLTKATTPSLEVPMGLPVSSSEAVTMATPLPVEPVVAPPPPSLSALSDAELAALAHCSVADWVAFCAPARPKSSGGWFSARSSKAPPAAEASDPKLFAVKSDDYGGIELRAQVQTQAGLLRLAQQLAAQGSAPLAALKISALDGHGPGTSDPMCAAGEALTLLARALMATELHGGAHALRSLRELSFSKITVDARAADALATALAGHHALEVLELWNVALDDDGARALARLGAPGGPQSLRTLNLGRNLLSPESRADVESVIDSQRVAVKLF